MSDLRKLAEQAMGYLADYTVGESPNASAVNDLIADLDAALAQPEQLVVGGDDLPTLTTWTPQRKRLTDDQIAEICMDCSLVTPSDIYFARAIERAHGIGEWWPVFQPTGLPDSEGGEV